MTKPVLISGAALFGLVLAACADQQGVSVATATAHPFVGSWDCEVSIFTFTNDTYDNGSGEEMVIRDVDVDGGNFILTFDDGYRIGLSDVQADTMTWLSFETGDQFDCTKLR